MNESNNISGANSPKSAKPAAPKNKVLIVVGPSGVGKDTLMQKVFAKNPERFKKAVTHTTRPMRPGEKEGVNYYYVSKEDFLQLKDKGGLVENNFYNNNYYGLSKMELEQAAEMADKILVAIIDINGAYSVNKLGIPANYLTILPPNETVLEKRLKGRGTESQEVIQGRLETAKEELKKIENSTFFNFRIVNDNLEKAANELYDMLKMEYPCLREGNKDEL